jgi:hypothetical protein
MQKVLCRLRWHTSAPMCPGLVRPTCGRGEEPPPPAAAVGSQQPEWHVRSSTSGMYTS